MAQPKGPVLSYKTSERVRIPASDLQPGMFVLELDRPWEETPFLFQGFQVNNYEEIRLVQELCQYVVVDVRGVVDFHATPKNIGAARQASTIRVEKTTPIGKELITAENTFEHSTRLVRDIMDEVRLGRSIDTPKAKEVVCGCVDSILRNQDALLMLTNIKNKDEYTAQHSLNVSILTIALGRVMGLDEKSLIDLGMCGLLHDVGKITTPIDVLNKPGRLTEEEFNVMKQHPTSGRDILFSSDGTPMAALDVAHGHHEAINGTGYPRGLNGDQMTLWAKMVAVTDTYDAITSDRVYQRGRTSLEGLKILSDSRGKRLDSELVVRFVRTVGLFPPGSVIELSSGEIAVVMENNTGAQLKPKVLVVKYPGSEQAGPKVVDLSLKPGDGKGNELRIQRMLRADDAEIDVKAIRDLGLLGQLAELPGG